MNIDKNVNELFAQNNTNTRLVTFVNPFSYYILEEKNNDLITSFDHIYADGMLLVKLNNLLYPQKKIKRYSFDFTSLAPLVFKYAIDRNMKVAIVGGSKFENEVAVNSLCESFPSLEVVFSRDGFFNNEAEIESTIQKMSSLNVDIVICGMGTPLQEMFLVKCKKNMPELKLGFTCGGFISQISVKKDYFHPFFDNLNLRWLQRAYRHSYVRKRLLIDYPKFVFKFIKSRYT